MRGIDLILLEDVMRRYPIEVDATARLFQVGGLVFVLLAVVGILVHDMVYRDPSAIARAPATTHQPILVP
jgi:hypothetical protein